MSLKDRTSAAAHRDIPHANPLSAAQLESLAKLVAASEPSTALEIGCGCFGFTAHVALAKE